MKYKVIKNNTQYNNYCNALEILIDSKKKSKAVQDEIELITLLIEKYDEEQNSFSDADPVQLLKSLMVTHKMKSVELSNLLGVSEGLISDMLNYKKGFSKETIRVLSEKFKMSQEAFNRPYKLLGANAKNKKTTRRIPSTKRTTA